MTEKESAIQRAIITYLKARHYVVWKNPIGPVMQGQKRWGTNPLKGFPDVSCVLKNDVGRLACLEVKASNGKTSIEQEDWLTRLSRAGVRCAVVRSLDGAIAALRAWGEPI